MKKASAKVRLAGSDDLFSSDLVRTEDGLISPQIFVDPYINQLELERIFARSWLFLAHESEIPQAGDYVTRVMGEDTVIVWRGQDGKIRVFLDVSRHRGRKICGDDVGKASHFRCPYHGWTYNNRGELMAVPFFDDYHGGLEKDSLGLYQTPGVDTYHGLIFANWNTNAEPLGEYLGEMKWALDLMFGRTDGLEVLGPPMKWVVEGNWKVGAANFSGDPVHLFTTHGFGAALGLENKQREQRLSYKMTTENGHAASLSLRGSSDKFFLGLPEELWPEMELHLTCEQIELMKRLSTIVGNVFPNMSFLNSSSRLPGEWGGGEGPMSFLNLRLFQPEEQTAWKCGRGSLSTKTLPGIGKRRPGSATYERSGWLGYTSKTIQRTMPRSGRDYAA